MSNTKTEVKQSPREEKTQSFALRNPVKTLNWDYHGHCETLCMSAFTNEIIFFHKVAAPFFFKSEYTWFTAQLEVLPWLFP